MSQEKLSTGEIIGITAGVTVLFAACCWWGIRKRLGMSKAKTKGSSDLELTATPSHSTLASTPRSQPPNPGVSVSSVSHQVLPSEASTTVVIISPESFSVSSPVIRPEHGSLTGSPRPSNSDQQHNLPLVLRNSSPYRGPLGSPRISGEETQGTDGSPRFSGTHYNFPVSPRNSGSPSPSPRISAAGAGQYNPHSLPQSVSFHKGSSESPRTSGELQKIEEPPRASRAGHHSSPRSSPQGTPKTSTTPKVRPYSVSNAARGVEFHEKGLTLRLHKPNGFEECVEMLRSETNKTREEINRTPLLNVKDMLEYLTQRVQELEDIAKKLEDDRGLSKEAEERRLVLVQIKVLNTRIEEVEKMIVKWLH